jgi:Mn-dependent DtxR family transcriptional regulator
LPASRTPADTVCLALCALADGGSLRGFMVSTIADRLGIDFYRAAEMADAAHAAGLVRHEHGTVTLTGEGLARGATFKPPTAS